MAKKNINIGQSVNDKTGDTLRSAFDKINQNFTELYNATGGGLDLLAVASNIVPDTDNTRTLGTPTKRWGHLYVGPGSISIGNAELTLEGGKIKSSTGFKLTDSQLDDVLPSQTGNAGKFLTTDGTHVLSWAAAAGGGVTSYTALTDKPTIPAAQIQSDWTQASNVALDFIKNKPALFSGSYTDLTNKPTIPSAYTLPTASASVLGGIKIGTGLSIDVNGVVTASAGGGSALVNGARTVSLGSDGTLTLPAQSATLTNVNQIVSAKIYRAGASTDTAEIAAAKDLWLGAESTFTDIRNQDAQISSGQSARPWAGMPSYTAYPVILNYQPTGGQLPAPGNINVAAKVASDYYLAYKELIRNIDIVAGNNIFSFENTGALRVPGIITKNNNLTLVSTGTIAYQQFSDQGLPAEVRNDLTAAVVADGENGRVFIRTDDGTTLRSWQFDVNGGLTLPGDLTLPSNGSIQSVNPNTQAKVTLNPYRVLSQVRTSIVQTYSVGGGAFTSAASDGTGTITFVGLEGYVAEYFVDNLDIGTAVEDKRVQINGAGTEYEYFSFNGTDQILLNGYPTAPPAGAVTSITVKYTRVSKIDICPDDGEFRIQSESGQDIDINAGRYLDIVAARRVTMTAGDEMRLRSGTGNPVIISTNYPGLVTPTLEWTFSNTGTLQLPLGSEISETGNSTVISPPGAGAGQSLVIYPTAGVPEGDHIHLTADGGTTDLYLGSDSQYVKIDHGGKIVVGVTNGIPNGVSNWVGQGGWNQGYYSAIATTGGSGTGLTVNVAAGGGGYINISAITIANPGSGYTAGDVITINNENNLPGTFTISVTQIPLTWQYGVTGAFTLPNSAVIGQAADIEITTAETNYTNSLTTWASVRASYQAQATSLGYTSTGWPFIAWTATGPTAAGFISQLTTAWQIQQGAPTSPPTPLIFNPPISQNTYNELRTALVSVRDSYANWQALLTSVEITSGSESITLLANGKLQVPNIIQTDPEEDLVIRTRYAVVTSPPGSGTYANRDFVFGTNGSLTAPGNLQVNGGKIILNTGGNAYVESVDYGVNSANSALNIFGGPYQKIKLRAGFGTEATWTLGTDGTLTFPNASTFDGVDFIAKVNDELNLTIPDSSAYIGVKQSNNLNEPAAYMDVYFGKKSRIRTASLNNQTEYDWYFNPNGHLTLPSNGSIASGVNTAQVGSSRRISFTDGGQGNYMAWGPEVLSVGYASNVDILTTFAAGSTITFVDGRVRTITAITAGVANAYIDITWTGAIADYLTVPVFPITLKTANFAAATTAPSWRFGNTAALTLPNAAFIKQSENTDISTALTAYNTAVTAWETTRKNEFVYSVLNDLPGLMSFAGWSFATWDDVDGTNAAAYLAIVNNAYTIQNSAPSSPPTPLVFTPALTAGRYTQLRSLLTSIINTYAEWQALLTSVDIWAGNEKLSLLSNNKIQVPGIIQTDVEEDLVIRTRYVGVTSPPAGSGQLSYANKDFVFSTNGSITFPRYDGSTVLNATVQGDGSGNLNLTAGNYVSIESNSYAAITLAKYTANTSVDIGNVTSPARMFGDLQIMTGRHIITNSSSINLINTSATTVNFAGAATTLNIGAAGGTTTIAGDLVVNGTTTTINSTTLTVDDKNIELGSVASPTDTTADGGGITLKGATDKTFTYVNSTGLWTANIGVQATSFTGLAATAVTASTASSLGYLGMPQNAKSSSANTVIGDQGKHIYITGPTTITIDGSLAYPIGATIAFINSTSTATIAITTNTMVLGGVGTTGSRSLAPYGMATAVKVTDTTWYINGVGLT